MRDIKTSRFKKSVRVTEKDYKFLIKNKYKKSIAGFLEYIINEFKKFNN